MRGIESWEGDRGSVVECWRSVSVVVVSGVRGRGECGQEDRRGLRCGRCPRCCESRPISALSPPQLTALLPVPTHHLPLDRTHSRPFQCHQRRQPPIAILAFLPARHCHLNSRPSRTLSAPSVFPREAASPSAEALREPLPTRSAPSAVACVTLLLPPSAPPSDLTSLPTPCLRPRPPPLMSPA